jgi:hypothetical protein
MNKHLKYLSYVIRHKWFVFVACNKLGVSTWRAIIHDWTKFLPCEWFAYVNSFYGDHPKWEDISSGQKLAGYPFELTKDYWKPRFASAWNHHQKSNKHHWQYWLLTNDSDDPKHSAIEMPDKYVREMVADWWGAGRAITGKWEANIWYEKQRNKILLHEKTRAQVEQLLQWSQRLF